MIPLGKPLEQILGIGALLLLVVGCALVLWPFLTALMWAAVICFSTWPLYRWCEQALGGRRGGAATLMSFLVALVLVAPFAIDDATTLTKRSGASRSLTTLMRTCRRSRRFPIWAKTWRT